MCRWSTGLGTDILSANKMTGLDYFFGQKTTPFVACMLYFVISFLVTVFMVAMDVVGIGSSTEGFQSYTIVDRLLLADYANSLPVLIKLSNQWGFGGYYQLARDVYAVNFLLLVFGLVYNSRLSLYWQIRMVSEIENEPQHEQDIRLDRIVNIRKFVFFGVVLLTFFLLFDDIADGKKDYFANRMIIDPWNAMRVPLMSSLLYGCLTYLMTTNHIFLFFDGDDEDSLELGYSKEPVRYDYTNAGSEEAAFEEVDKKGKT